MQFYQTLSLKYFNIMSYLKMRLQELLLLILELTFLRKENTKIQPNYKKKKIFTCSSNSKHKKHLFTVQK